MRRNVAAGLALVAMTLACNANDTVSNGGNDTPALTAKFDGATWTATTLNSTFANGLLSVTSSSTGLGAFAFAVVANAPGTYTLSPTSGISASYVLLSSSWTAGGSNGSGTVTISTFTTNTVSGTFSFQLPAVAGTAATGTKSITTGTFTVKY